METIGVEAVVSGLSAFVGDMDKIQSSIEKIGPPASILQDAFGALGEAAGNFASWVADVLTYTLGNLLADAIRGTIALLGDMATAAFDSGNAFQALRVRLVGINFNDPSMGLSSFMDGMQQATALTKDQIKWIKIMAIITPFTAEGIASVYTLQRAMGLSDDAAKKLLVSITNFAAGTALPESGVVRLSDAFAKMTSGGKVNGLLFRQLRSEYTPINAILDVVQKNLGLTTAEFEDMTASAKIPPEEFIKAFEQVANQRFPDAASALAHTWQGAVNNMQDIVANFGENITGPILDTVGKFAGNVIDTFATMTADGGIQLTALGQRLDTAATGIGESLAGIIASVLGLAPSADEVAGGFVTGIEQINTWLTDNKDAIVTKIKEIVDWFVQLGNPKSDFQANVIQPFRDLYDTLFNLNPGDQITKWDLLKFSIEEVAKAVGGVLTGTLKQLGITDMPKTTLSVGDLVMALLRFSDWIKENQVWLSWLLTIIISFIILQTITNIVWGFIAGLVGIAVTVLTVIAVVGTLFTWLVEIIAIVAAVTIIFKLAQIQFSNFAVGIQFGIDLVLGYFNNMYNTIRSILTRIDTAWRNGDWWGIGWAIVSGIADGIMRNVSTVTQAAQDAAWSAYTAAKRILNMRSPSKVFAGIGENMMLGMAEGITASASAAVSAMQSAVGAVSVPAMAAPSVMAQYSSAPSSISNTYQQSNSYNLQINSSANTENIVADFNMLESLAG